MSIRVAVVGISHWHAPRHLEALVQEGATIAGVSDADLPTAGRVAARLGCPCYADHRTLLDAVKPDFVLAMPRHADAAAVTADLLDTGLPLAVEKPLGLDAGQVAPLAERARRRGAYVAVAFVNRYSPLWERLSDLATGDARHAHFRIVNGPPERYERAGCGWMLDPALAGGGALRNLGIHGADAVVTLAGGAVDALAVVDARLGGPAGVGGIEDYAVALVAGPGGLLATIEAGYTYPVLAAGMTRGGDAEWRVATRDAYLVDRDDTLTVAGPAGEQVLASPSSSARYRRFVADALDRFRRGRPPVAGIEDCYRAMRLIDAIYRRAGAPWLHQTQGETTP